MRFLSCEIGPLSIAPVGHALARLVLLLLTSLLISACATNSVRKEGTRALDGFYNRHNASCNYQNSVGGWHVISSAFSAADFRLFGAHPQQFYLYLIHDPTSGEDASLASLRGLTQRGRVSRDERLQLYIGAWPLFDGRPAVGPSGIPRPLVGLSVRPSTASFFVVLSPSFVEALPAAARAAIPGERALAIPSALTDRYSLSFAIEGQDPLLFEARAEAVRRTLMSRNRYTGKLTPATDYAGVAFVASQATFTEQLPTGADSLSAKRTYSPDLMTALGYLGYDFVRQELGLTVTLKKDDVTIYQEVFDNAQLPGVLLNLGHHHFNDHIQKRECY